MKGSEGKEHKVSSAHQLLVPGKPWTLTLSPGAAPLGGSSSSTLSGELAHSIRAWDTTLLVLAGFRLQSTTARRFCILHEGHEGKSFTS